MYVWFLFLKIVLENSFSKHEENYFSVLRKLFLFFEFGVFYILMFFRTKKKKNTGYQIRSLSCFSKIKTVLKNFKQVYAWFMFLKLVLKNSFGKHEEHHFGVI